MRRGKNEKKKEIEREIIKRNQTEIEGEKERMEKEKET